LGGTFHPFCEDRKNAEARWKTNKRKHDSILIVSGVIDMEKEE